MRNLLAALCLAAAVSATAATAKTAPAASNAPALPRELSGNELGSVLEGTGSRCPKLEQEFDKGVCLTTKDRKIWLVNVVYSIDAMDGITFDDLMADLELHYGRSQRHPTSKQECMGYDDHEKNSTYTCAVWDRAGEQMMLYLRRHQYKVQGKTREEYSYGWTIRDLALMKAAR